MIESKNKPKRIVSKIRYAFYIAQSLSLSLIGGMMLVCAAIGAILAFFSFIVPVIGDPPREPNPHKHVLPAYYLFGIAGGFSGGSLLSFWFGKRLLLQVKSLEPIVPSTRHNIEQLPPEKSLVRASSSQDAPPETILLRAAAPSVTPPEQLLRPIEPE